MIFEIAFMILCFLLPAAAFFAFALGYHAGRQVRSGSEIIHRPLFSTRAHETPEEARARAIHDNIENYGTGRKQEDVE